ncbi:hypothetical protein ACWGH4_34425, partial [Streptomyces sp. NPDC054847]
GDPQHNGHRGYKIDDITEIVKRDTGVMRPNVVTLMAVTCQEHAILTAPHGPVTAGSSLFPGGAR